MTFKDYLKSPIYRKNRRIVEFAEKYRPIVELADRLGKQNAFFNSPAFQRLQSLSDFGLTTKAARLEVFENLEELVKEAEEYQIWLRENHLSYKEDQVKPVLNEWRELIKKDYGLNIDLGRFLSEALEGVNIKVFSELDLDEDYILTKLLEYAQNRKVQYSRLKRLIAPSTAIQKKELPKTFEELFDNPEKLAFVNQMLVDEGFFKDGVLFLNQRERFRIPALCDALKVKRIIPDLPDNVLHYRFSDKIGLTPNRYSRKPDAYEMAKNQYIKYIDNHYRPVTPRIAPK